MNNCSMLTIDVCGDISLAWLQDVDGISNTINEINRALEPSDWRIANFEMAIKTDSSEPIIKDGPNLYCSVENLGIIEQLNIDAYTLANNHVGDYGEESVRNTIEYLKSIDKNVCGAGTIKNRYEPIRLEKKGQRVSLFSFCENEFGVSESVGVAGFRAEELLRIYKEKEGFADIVVVIFHGGTEYNPFPSPMQQVLYRSIAAAGADVVIGMHQHCIQGCEIYEGSHIFYGIGNFLFPTKIPSCFPSWCYGIIVRLRIQDQEINTEIIPFRFISDGSGFIPINQDVFEPFFYELSFALKDESMIKQYYDNWCLMVAERKIKALENGITKHNRSKQTAFSRNAFSCEAHRELFIKYFDLFLRKECKRNDELLLYTKKLMNTEEWINNSHEHHPVDIHSEAIGVHFVIWGCSVLAYYLYNSFSDVEKRATVFADANPIIQGLCVWGGRAVLDPMYAVNEYRDAKYYLCMRVEECTKICEYLASEGVSEKNVVIVTNTVSE